MRKKEVHSHVLQDVSMRVDPALQVFFRRVRNGEDATITSMAASTLSRHLKVWLHRPIEGVIKRLTIRRSSTKKWHVYIAKSVLDASWSRFRTYVMYKAASAGRKVVLVSPDYTGCGTIEI